MGGGGHDEGTFFACRMLVQQLPCQLLEPLLQGVVPSRPLRAAFVQTQTLPPLLTPAFRLRLGLGILLLFL